ncbi:hypothetical protein PoB_004890700 [Plakobranchus ocellatus]|uniref:Uncharacterized protein n=1 Tax=Plakobranchus ocellatus TaxID=259542 RepID=A0AAV4BSN0_9GAST|nr:hypothetical protein PoB_004890700 [Plakobranchus ocellatus]
MEFTNLMHSGLRDAALEDNDNRKFNRTWLSCKSCLFTSQASSIVCSSHAHLLLESLVAVRSSEAKPVRHMRDARRHTSDVSRSLTSDATRYRPEFACSESIE